MLIDIYDSSVSVPTGMLMVVYALLAAFVVLESHQRIRDYWNRRKARNKHYNLCFETTKGAAVVPESGPIISVHHPHLIYRLKGSQRTPHVTINSQGFRGKDWAVNSQSSVRIIVLGNSTVFGGGSSSDEHVFVNVLGRLLNASSHSSGKSVEVLNAGVIGYTSSEELILVATTLLDYQPNLLIVMDGWTDLYVSGVLPQGTTEPVSPVFHAFDNAMTGYARRWFSLLRLSALFRRLERELIRDGQPAEQPARFGRYSDNVRPALHHYRRNLERMIRMAKAYGAEVILASQPELFHRKGTVPESELKLRKERNRKRHEGYADFVMTQYPLFIKSAQEIARAEGIPFVDSTKAFDEFEGVAFLDFVHLTKEGNERLARHLLPTVSQVLSRTDSSVSDRSASPLRCV